MLSQLSKVHKSANIEHILFIVVLIVQGTFSGGSKNVIRMFSGTDKQHFRFDKIGS